MTPEERAREIVRLSQGEDMVDCCPVLIDDIASALRAAEAAAVEREREACERYTDFGRIAHDTMKGAVALGMDAPAAKAFRAGAEAAAQRIAAAIRARGER